MSKPLKVTDRNAPWNRTRKKTRAYELNSRQPEKLYLIICEGQNTEPDYFKAFPLATAQVKTIGKGLTKTKLVESVIKYCKESKDCEGREVWIVFDMDLNLEQANSQITDANNAIALAKRKSYNVAFSNDAFELWVLLHYQEVSGPLHRKQLYKKLSSHLGIGYEKEGKKKKFTLKLHKILEEDPNADQAEAVRRASKLIDEAESEGKSPPEANPYTSVVALAVELNQHL